MTTSAGKNFKSVIPSVRAKYIVHWGNNKRTSHRLLRKAREQAKRKSITHTRKGRLSYIYIFNRKRFRYDFFEQYLNGKKLLRGVTKGRGTIAIRPRMHRVVPRPRKATGKAYMRPSKKEQAKDLYTGKVKKAVGKKPKY